MSHLVVKFEDNYADEFDVYGFIVCTTDEWEKKKLSLKEHFKKYGPYEYGFGTNEDIVYATSDDLLGNCTVTEITEEAYNSMVAVFGTKFGHFPI